MKKIAQFIYCMLDKMSKKPSKILHDHSVYEAMQILEPASNAANLQKEYVIQKLSLCVTVVVGGFILAILLCVKEMSKTAVEDNAIERNAYGNGKKSVSLVGKSENGTYEIDLSVEEKLYSEAELKALLLEFIPMLERAMLGENESPDKIEYDIKLPKGVNGFPFNVEWQTDNKYIGTKGELINNTLSAPALTKLTAVISCESFEVYHELSCMVHSKAVQPERGDVILNELEKTQSKTRNEKFMTLPEEIGSEKLIWSYKKSYVGILFMAAVPLIAIVIYLGKDKDLKKKVEDRNEQLKADYPEIVSALALLIGAGMTVPNAWQRVVSDYRAEKAETGRVRYAYEEMLLTIYEMESGIAQTNAYERFGRRCKIQSYNRLSTMLSQNVKKGAADIAGLLREEAKAAFEERKHNARRLGEKAGTKLLMPMMLLLCMIMMVIMVPAFKNYF